MKNMGEAYTHKVTLRLNDNQYNHMIDVSNLLGVRPSDYIRMMINSSMVSLNNTNVNLGEAIKEVGTNENVKTDSNNQL